jgi:hypothetical protein
LPVPGITPFRAARHTSATDSCSAVRTCTISSHHKLGVPRCTHRSHAPPPINPTTNTHSASRVVERTGRRHSTSVGGLARRPPSPFGHAFVPR